MRPFVLTLSLLLTFNISQAQSSAVDKLFDKYALEEGFSSVHITKHMFELFAEKNMAMEESEAMQEAISGIESIKILTIEDSVLNHQINFYDEIGKDIPFDEYKTLLVVKETGQHLRMMIKESNGKISEFLMLGGGDDNVLINIIGEIDLDEILKISQAIDVEGMQDLKGVR